MALTSDLDAAERSYINRLPHVVGANLYSSCIGNDFWYRAVMRELRTEPTIREAVLAICALDVSFASRPPRASHPPDAPFSLFASPSTWGPEANKHYTRALIHQAKAIENLRRRLRPAERGVAGPRTVLVASLLLVIFELMLGLESDHMGMIATGALSVLTDHIVSLKPAKSSHTTYACPNDTATRRCLSLSREVDDDGFREAEIALTRVAASYRKTLERRFPEARQRLFGWMDVGVHVFIVPKIGPPSLEAPPEVCM
ncbi:uncharacterized protein B0I36DRAFT_353591 [Microdochium trichocladiopsis]|uniref:Uncharacterized protein n=1 Tax=Microdochium trichocladiopsis TaxID=1682393 RepID=A0A9P8XXJ3_9PEZI|nr:uncharacterized protein B0I36DRAFT_353591 [Microdochium trichocladiopsis]KAH7020850.1 hypothetical protein B0I36DRAFT_353591 [Microdochium trichocladiopsis]